MTAFLVTLVSVILVLGILFLVFRRAVGIIYWIVGGVLIVLVVAGLFAGAFDWFFDEVSLPFKMPALFEEIFSIFFGLLESVFEFITYPFRNR